MHFSSPLRGIRVLVSAALVKLFYRPPDKWEMLRADDALAIWKTLSPLLEFHGLFVRWVWDRENLNPPPPAAPQNAFIPLPNEDFLRRMEPGVAENDSLHVVRGLHKIGSDHLGREVYMKALPSTSKEMVVMRHLLSPSLKSDTRNHTIPVIRIIELRGWSLLIFPRWGFVWYKPVRESFARRVEIARDLLEGLAFMHLNGVTHGDIHSGNILCGHENSRWGKPERQQDVHLPQAFIDFESAVIFPPGALDHCVKVDQVNTMPPLGIRAPEQEDEKQWDGFAADVYNLGQTFRENLELEANQEWVAIVDAMTRCEPSKRVSADEAFLLMDELLKKYTTTAAL